MTYYRVFPARFDGECMSCMGQIEAGWDPIAIIDGEPVHESCIPDDDPEPAPKVFDPDHSDQFDEGRSRVMSQHNKHDDEVKAALARLMAMDAGSPVTDSGITLHADGSVTADPLPPGTRPGYKTDGPIGMDPEPDHPRVEKQMEEYVGIVQPESKVQWKPAELEPIQSSWDDPAVRAAVKETVASSPEPGNDSVQPEPTTQTCEHCGAEIAYIPQTERWVTVKEGFRVASCRTSPTLTHEPFQPGINPGGDHKTPHSTQIWKSVAGAEPKVTGQVELGGLSVGPAIALEGSIVAIRGPQDPEAAQKKANFDRSVAELRAEMGEPFPGIVTQTVSDLPPVVPPGIPGEDYYPPHGARPNWPAQPMEPEPEGDPEEVDVTAYADRVQALKEAREAEKAAKERAEEARAELLQLMGDRKYATVHGQRVVQITMVESTRLDTKALREKHPRIAKRFDVTKTHPRLDIL